MKKIHTLGPLGTYSEIATIKYLKNNTNQYDVKLYPSIDHVFKHYNNNDLLILPFLNSIDGYVLRTVDLLNQSNLFISDIISLPISFSFISNEKDISTIKNVYVQFKTKNQVLEFLSNHDFNYIITESNAISLNQYLKNQENSAGIIPTHLVNQNYNITINNIEEIKGNVTKFVVLSNELIINKKWVSQKIFISLTPKVDKPGLLYNLLSVFKDLDINLSAIFSRPIKNKIGKYHFYLELDANHLAYEKLFKILNDNNDLTIKMLGIYNDVSK